MIIVILSGGSGTRLWPASRQQKPKQFLRLFGAESLLIQTARRALAAHAEKIIILTNADQAPLAQADLAEAGIAAEVLVEPAQRNTGPAITFVAAHLTSRGYTGPLAFLPADHFVPDADAFAACLAQAEQAAVVHDRLVVVGKRPERPETGYGYIEQGAPVTENVFQALRFVEKPDTAKALAYVSAGNFWWNTGLLVARAPIILDEIRLHAPGMAAAVLDAVGAPARYAEAPNLSFDYAVLEKSGRVAVVEAQFTWSDVGNWNSWAEESRTWDEANAHPIETRVIALAAHGNTIWSDKTVVLQDVEGLVVIDTTDVLYVTTQSAVTNIGAARQAALAADPSLS